MGCYLVKIYFLLLKLGDIYKYNSLIYLYNNSRLNTFTDLPPYIEPSLIMVNLIIDKSLDEVLALIFPLNIP